MDYHSDRFNDHSLLFYHKEKLVALLPANEKEKDVHSHQGLTYGGLIISEHTNAQTVLNIFEELLFCFLVRAFQCQSEHWFFNSLKNGLDCGAVE